jgi:hypothetical protein
MCRSVRAFSSIDIEPQRRAIGWRAGGGTPLAGRPLVWPQRRAQCPLGCRI